MINVKQVYEAEWTTKDKFVELAVKQKEADSESRNNLYAAAIDDIVAIFSDPNTTAEDKRTALSDRIKLLGSFVMNNLVEAIGNNPKSSYAPSAPFIQFQTDSGVVIPDTSSALEIAEELYKETLGYDVDTSTETHVGRMIEQTGIFLKSGIGITAANIMQSNLNYATGAYLDAVAHLLNLYRTDSNSTSFQLELELTEDYHDNPIKLEKGDLVITDGSGVKYILASDVSFNNDYFGPSRKVPFVCEKSGPVEVNDVGIAFTKTSKYVNTDVNPRNRIDYVIGRNEENDTEFRARIKKSRSNAVSFLDSVKSALYGIRGVYDAYVCENTTATYETIGEVPSVEPHSIFAFVRYDGTDNVRDSIARALFERKATGCAYATVENTKNKFILSAVEQQYRSMIALKDTKVNVQEKYFGHTYTVCFTEVAPIQFGILMEVSRYQYSGSDLNKVIRAKLLEWANGEVEGVDGMKISQDVKAFEIGSAISAMIPDIQIDNIRLIRYAWVHTSDGSNTYKLEDTENLNPSVWRFENQNYESADGGPWITHTSATNTTVGTLDDTETSDPDLHSGIFLVNKIVIHPWEYGEINFNDVRIRFTD